jgi:hypothetical protein
MRMLTNKMDYGQRDFPPREDGQSARHWPFLECPLAKLEETHGARIYNGDDD